VHPVLIHPILLGHAISELCGDSRRTVGAVPGVRLRVKLGEGVVRGVPGDSELGAVVPRMNLRMRKLDDLA
jgi:hypothetical protein